MSRAHPYRLPINPQVGKLEIGPETFRLLVGTRRQRRWDCWSQRKYSLPKRFCPGRRSAAASPWSSRPIAGSSAIRR